VVDEVVVVVVLELVVGIVVEEVEEDVLDVVVDVSIGNEEVDGTVVVVVVVVVSSHSHSHSGGCKHPLLKSSSTSLTLIIDCPVAEDGSTLYGSLPEKLQSRVCASETAVVTADGTGLAPLAILSRVAISWCARFMLASPVTGRSKISSNSDIE
jgi:hypothetical protein